MRDRNEKEEFVPEEDLNAENKTNDCDNADEANLGSDNLSDDEESADWQEKYTELNNSYLRLHAEFDNYRKRTMKEKMDLIKTAGERVIVDSISVVDDFERAMNNISSSSDLNAVKEGVELIYNKFIDFLLKNGVKKMDVIGQTFDEDKHEALTTVPSENEESKDKIVDCIQQGYEMGDKVIRYPKVIVAK